MKKTRIFKIKRKQKLFIYSLILIYVDVISEGMLKIQWSSEWMYEICVQLTHCLCTWKVSVVVSWTKLVVALSFSSSQSLHFYIHSLTAVVREKKREERETEAGLLIVVFLSLLLLIRYAFFPLCLWFTLLISLWALLNWFSEICWELAPLYKNSIWVFENLPDSSVWRAISGKKRFLEVTFMYSVCYCLICLCGFWESWEMEIGYLQHNPSRELSNDYNFWGRFQLTNDLWEYREKNCSFFFLKKNSKWVISLSPLSHISDIPRFRIWSSFHLIKLSQQPSRNQEIQTSRFAGCSMLFNS